MKTALNLAMSLLLATAVLSPVAQARERETKVTGQRGKTAERNVTREKGDVTSSTTGPNGKSTSRSVDRSATGATASATGARGKTLTRETTRTETGSTTTVTGSDGKTKTVTVEKQKQP